MSKELHSDEGLYRFKIISPLINEIIPRGELRKKIKEISEKFFEHPVRGWEKFAYKTIEEWYYNYKRGGFVELEKKVRADKGKTRSIEKELGELILVMKQENPQNSVRQILKQLVLAGKIQHGEISRSSVYRMFSSQILPIKLQGAGQTEIKRFAFAFSNECWQSDVSHGPYLNIIGYPQKKKIYIIGFLDDASRIIPHAGIFLSEDLENLLEALKNAVLKKGIPNRLYLDNASYFRSPVLQKIGARLGMKILHCTPYSPYKKGKLERFWQTLKTQFISNLDRDRKYTLEELNRLLLIWIEKDYHHAEHSSLGKSPIDSWQEKHNNIRYPDASTFEYDFLAEESRTVRKDGIIALRGICFEVDSTLAGVTIIVRFNPFKLDKVYIYLQDKLIQEALPVNEIENQKTTRKKIPTKTGQIKSGINFIDLLEKKESEKNV